MVKKEKAGSLPWRSGSFLQVKSRRWRAKAGLVLERRGLCQRGGVCVPKVGLVSETRGLCPHSHIPQCAPSVINRAMKASIQHSAGEQ